MPKIWQNLKNITDWLLNMDPRDASASKNALTSFLSMNLKELRKIANEIILHGGAEDFGTVDYKIIDHLNTFG